MLPPLLKGKRQCPALFCRGGASSGSNPVKHVARGENGGKWRKAECNVSRCQPVSGDICYLQYVKRGQKWRLGEWNEDKNDLSRRFWQSQAHVPDFLCQTFFPRTASQFRITCICLGRGGEGGEVLKNTLPSLPSSIAIARLAIYCSAHPLEMQLSRIPIFCTSGMDSASLISSALSQSK